MILNLIGWIIFGLIVGAIARLLMPGRDTMGWLGTIIVGVVGSIIGGYLGTMLFGQAGDEFAPAGFLGALVGALIVLGILRMFRSRRPAH